MENIYTGNIDGLKLIKPRVFEDERGYFMETYQAEKYKALGIEATFVQDNESKSSYGVLRGLHFQTGAAAQAKLVRVTQGKVWDVAVDIRPNSPTYGQYFGVELSEENKLQFFVPRGFAHGFLVLSKSAVFNYKCDNYYNKEAESGIIYNDPTLNIPWPIPLNQCIISEKDLQLSQLKA